MSRPVLFDALSRTVVGHELVLVGFGEENFAFWTHGGRGFVAGLAGLWYRDTKDGLRALSL